MKRSLFTTAALMILASLFLLPLVGNAGLPVPPLPPPPPLLLPPPPPGVVVIQGEHRDSREYRREKKHKKHKKHRDEHEYRHDRGR